MEVHKSGLKTAADTQNMATTTWSKGTLHNSRAGERCPEINLNISNLSRTPIHRPPRFWPFVFAFISVFVSVSALVATGLLTSLEVMAESG